MSIFFVVIKLSLHIYRKASETIGLTVINVIFRKLHLNCRNKVINFIVLFMKQYLVFCLVPNLIKFLSHLNIKFNVEIYTAFQSFKVHKFEKIRDTWKDIFD